MTRSSDLVMVEREPTEAMLNAARDWSMAKYGIGIGNDAAAECWQAMIAAALQSVEGGVQGSIATKQESCPEGAPRTETATAIYSVLSSACIEHSALSVSGFNLFGDSKSIKAAQEWLHSHSQIGDLKTNLRHWRDECGKLHAQLTKTPSADHDAGNLRGLAEPTPRDSSESTTGGAAPDHTTMEERA